MAESTKPHYVKDVSKLEGSGIFPCPKCGVEINPRDFSEEIYKVRNPQTTKYDELKKLTAECLKCGAQIDINGFNKQRKEAFKVTRS